MKKTYFAIGLFALVNIANGQSGILPKPRVAKAAVEAQEQITRSAPIDLNAAGYRNDPFWTEDFSSTPGIPAGWTNVDVGTPQGQPNVVFEWADDPAAVFPAALGHNHMATFNSSDADDGYLWANSDRGLTSAPPNNHRTQLTTTAIDCSDQPTVLLRFQSVIGVFDNPASEFARVRVSTDMSNWTSFSPFPCLTITSSIQPPCERFSANPTIVELDITSAAGGQPTVYIQWDWEGGWEYYWAIDDVALLPVPEYSRQIINSFQSHNVDTVQFGRIPSDQFLSTLLVGGTARNTGLNPQNNVTLTAVLNTPGGSFNEVQTIPSLPVGPDTVTYGMSITLPGTMAEGPYSVDFSLTSDEDDMESSLDDDMQTRYFEVTNSLYSLDALGVDPGPSVILSTGTSSFVSSDTQDNLAVMAYYPVHESLTVYGIEALITTGSRIGASYEMSIHPLENVLAETADLDNPIVTSDILEVTNADSTAHRLRVTFPGGVVLQPGDYYAAVTLFSNQGSNHIAVLDDNTILQPDFASVTFFPGADGGIGGTGNAFAIRLLLDPTVGVNEQEALQGVSIYPNPTNGLLNVNVAADGSYLVEVLNMLGERVQTTRIVNNTILDLSGMASGVYMVRVSNGNASMIERVTLH